MQKMLTLMQRPGIDHLKLSKMNFLGMGPWMIGKLSKQYNVASPRELLEACQAMGVEFIPCQMTMDMFGLKREDMIDGLGRACRRRHRARADDPAQHGQPVHLIPTTNESVNSMTIESPAAIAPRV